MTADQFLHLIAPRLQLRLKGFRKVRRQVFRRFKRRMVSLELDGFEDYWEYVGGCEDEWKVLAELCRVTITRFYRDRGLWEFLTASVVPRVSRCWSAGCASGEEAYTLSIAAGGSLEILGTDIDEVLLERARAAVYPLGVLRDLPPAWRSRAFDGGRLRAEFRRGVSFSRADMRDLGAADLGRFDLVLCRNSVFTYFEPSLQLEILGRMAIPGCYLVLGCHEQLPPGAELEVIHAHHRVFRWPL